jgi:ribosome-associated translation inhibitor RaiA
MYIEFFTPPGEVRESIIKYVRERLTELHKTSKKISRAEVHFRSQAGEHICEIELIILGESIFVQCKDNIFENAAREACEKCGEKIQEQLKNQNRTS